MQYYISQGKAVVKLMVRHNQNKPATPTPLTTQYVWKSSILGMKHFKDGERCKVFASNKFLISKNVSYLLMTQICTPLGET